MSIARHLGLATLVVATWSTLGAPAFAQETEKGPTKAERATAREAYEKGTKAFEKGDYLKALDNFVKANALIPSVQAMFWIAQAQDKLGRTDAAIEAYEAVTARADFTKLSEDKATLVRERLAALKPPPPPPPPPAETPPPAPPVETAPSALPEPAPQAAPVVNEPPASPPETSPEPRANVVEVGLTFGTMFVPDNHNLLQKSHQQVPFDSPVWQLGLRGAYFPMSYLGFEGEYVHGFGQVAEVNYSDRPSLPNNRTANFDALRAHVIG